MLDLGEKMSKVTANKELSEQPKINQEKLSKALDHLSKALDHLREGIDRLNRLQVYVKYLVFDLEATRRENKYLQQLLAEKDDEDDELIG